MTIDKLPKSPAHTAAPNLVRCSVCGELRDPSLAPYCPCVIPNDDAETAFDADEPLVADAQGRSGQSRIESAWIVAGCVLAVALVLAAYFATGGGRP